MNGLFRLNLWCYLDPEDTMAPFLKRDEATLSGAMGELYLKHGKNDIRRMQGEVNETREMEREKNREKKS